MRVLIMSTPASSHFGPVVPLLWALRAAGHEVLVVGQPDVTDAARAAGLPTAVLGDVYDAHEIIRAKLPAGRRPNEAGRAQVTELNPAVLIQPWLLHARYLTADYLAFARRWHPDLVISDPFELSALAVAGILGVPLVHHRWDLDAGGGQPVSYARDKLGARFARLGLTGELPGPALVLDPCPPSVQLESADPARAMRYVPYNGAGTVPSWVSEPPCGLRVAVTFGALTASLNGIPLFRTVIEALEGIEGVETLVTLPASYQAELGPLPACARLVEPTPLHLFLDSCDAVVHHGGTGSTLTSCAFGVPQLILPQLGNEPVWAARLAEHGVARAVIDPQEQNDPAVLRAAALALLEDTRHAESARLLAKEISTLPTPADLVPELERLAGR